MIYQKYLYGQPGRIRQMFIAVATGWLPTKAWRRAMRGILTMGVRNYWRVRRTDKTRQFPHTLAIAAIMKDEGPYLKEWLDFHIAVGVDKFYLYDNGSTDNSARVLAPYIRRGIVDLIPFSGKSRQNDAYIDALARFRDQTKWLVRLDLDEFVVPVRHDSIPQILDTLPRGAAQLILTWVCYGSAGHEKKPRGLVIENFKYHEVHHHGIKSIVNPRLVVRQSNPHQADVAGFTVDENGRHLGRVHQSTNPPSCNIIRCNHYITKSHEEFIARCRKGSGSGGRAYANDKAKRFAEMDTNDVYDPVMDRWIEKLKKK